MTDETQTIRGEIGTSGDFAEVDITGDSGADIASAIVLEHHCDSASCDIARAVADGYPFWAASLLQNATETPLLDAVIAHYCAAGLDFSAMAERDREQWLASETWTQHAHKCDSCGAVTFGDDYWTPTQCDDCGAELTTDETSAAVLEFMAADPAGTEFTTQQVAEFCLRDPFRAGELRDAVFPALVAAGKVEILPADDDHNATRYVLRVADPETDMSKRVVAVGRIEDGRVMYGSIAADFGTDSDRAAVTPAFAPRLRLNCPRCGAVCGDLSDRHPMCFACETETAALAAEMVSEGFASDWRPATALERRRGYVVALRLPGCWQALSARGLQEFADNERWLSQPS